MSRITPWEVELWQQNNVAFTLLDVRRSAAVHQCPDRLPHAEWRDPALWLEWKDSLLDTEGPVVLYCAHGHELSQGLTAALEAMQVDARYMIGGIAGWTEEQRPTEAIT